MVKFDIPVLFLIFNRLDTAQQVFAEIKKAKPKQLFIAADGPRNKEEKKKTDAVRKYVLDNIDWKCDVKTLFRKKNLGCGKAVSQAITWFFDNVEMGIILGDDCLPSQSFFPFCEELLKKYKNDERIMHINGSNFQNGERFGCGSYYFSKNVSVWGWATWRRAWNHYDFYLKNFNIIEFKKNLRLSTQSKKEYLSIINMFDLVSKKRINTWDYQWQILIYNLDKLTIYPNFNLVSNIGFGINSTHTNKKSFLGDKPICDIDSIIFLDDVNQNKKADLNQFNKNNKLFYVKFFIIKLKELIRCF